MPIKEAMLTSIHTLKPDDDVGTAITLMLQTRINSLPVVDNDNRLIGVLGVDQIIHHVLPVGVSLDAELNYLEFLHGATAWMVKRLHKTAARKVQDIMVAHALVTHPESPIPEGLRLLLHSRGSIPVINDQHKICGVVSLWSVLEMLQNYQLDAEDEDLVEEK